ncbi:hypothetical protein DFJ58DRAFT_777255 [Suillus subalutaceus]|uniref:uncharacterized protein n=1 Tax=Suillus subalutaceus TaxID=48586 RepID=UPI001B85FE37|nr:uncharacterized protein DFJ58DRAFT_777255 [Suillus subalutaceus]KAG1861543.1 hypothetical protein DFJ58DRAFT_777255 [Suillus subalutaceus]
MTQTNEDQVIDGQPRDIANPASPSPPSDSEDSHQFPPSPPGIHDNQQQPPPVFAVAPSPSQSPEAGEMITLSPQPPAITQAEGIPNLPQRPLDVDVDPRIASLHAMFPDFDDSLLSSVLQSVNGDQDLAIDTLLGMSDPDYREPTQTDLDEQLARRLMLEEEQAAQNQWRPPQQEQGPQYYQSRQSASRDRAGGDETGRYTGTAQVVTPPQRDTMTEFQDGFNKIAETGKKTFSSIVSKVKAKMQEYDQGQGASRQDTQPTWGQSSQPSWGSGQPTQSQYQSSYHDPNPQHQESYYDPNPPVDSGIRGSGWQSPPRPGGGNANPRTNSVPTLAPSATYVPPNFATKPIPNPTSVASSSPTYAGSSTYSPPTTGMGTSPPPELARRSGDTSRPPSTGVAKFGLLPKRPVSLLREQPPPTHRDDSDDELEYTENPFEERR